LLGRNNDGLEFIFISAMCLQLDVRLGAELIK